MDAFIEARNLLPEVYLKENLEIFEKGCDNLIEHIQNATKFGLSVIVAINYFTTDITAKSELICKKAIKAGADNAVLSSHWKFGAKGALELAKSIVKVTSTSIECTKEEFKFLYDLNRKVMMRLIIPVASCVAKSILMVMAHSNRKKSLRPYKKWARVIHMMKFGPH